MNYLVIELQTTNGTTANLVTQYNDLAKAQQKYYSVLAAAVVSKVDVHSAMIVDETGFLLMNESFKHIAEE